MNSPDYYRSEAAQLRELAARSRDPEAVRRWLHMALEYERLARTLGKDRADAGPFPKRQPVQGQQTRTERDAKES
jgi:hypothetical protein